MSQIGYQARPLSRRDIRALATRVRAASGYAERPYIDVEEMLDFILPKLMPEFGYGVLPSRETGNNHGLADPDRAFIWLRDDVYDRACQGKGRDRLTIVHEVGHVLLHTSDIVLRRGDDQPEPFRDPEWQANCFAGELLMAHTLVRQLSVGSVQGGRSPLNRKRRARTAILDRLLCGHRRANWPLVRGTRTLVHEA